MLISPTRNRINSIDWKLSEEGKSNLNSTVETQKTKAVHAVGDVYANRGSLKITRAPKIVPNTTFSSDGIAQ